MKKRLRMMMAAEAWLRHTFDLHYMRFPNGTTINLHPGYLPINQTTVCLYKIGKLSAYHKADWKPPKAC